jgi:hypothetical protein
MRCNLVESLRLKQKRRRPSTTSKSLSISLSGDSIRFVGSGNNNLGHFHINGPQSKFAFHFDPTKDFGPAHLRFIAECVSGRLTAPI